MKLLYILGLVIFFSSPLFAETFVVNSQVSFNSALDNSNPGDSILWSEGVYSDVFLNVEEDGLYIAASILGGTIFTGDSYAELRGDDMTFKGFQFLDGDIGDEDIINIRGSNILITEINMRGYTSYKYLRIREESQFVTVLRCNFENRLNLDDQNILSILVDADQPGFHKVQYCSFKNFDGTGNDLGIEPIRVGVSSQADRDSRSLIEFCYFTECDGDGELISSKASQNVYRYNTFENNSKAELVLRHGSEAVVYGNFFLNGKGGVRVREGQGHYIYNNYFYEMDDRPIYLQNENSDPLDDINIAFNLVHDCSEVRLGGDGNDPPTNVTFANNIFSNPDDDLFEKSTGDETWISNIAFGDLGISTPSGITISDPLLSENNEGFFGITENSPAVDAAQSGFKPIPQFEGMDMADVNIDLDIMMAARPTDISSKDLGCSEYPLDIPLRPHANEENTGTTYNSSLSTSTSNFATGIDIQLDIYPNPTSEIINVLMMSEQVLDLEFSVFDIDGKVMKSLRQVYDFSGELSFKDSINELPSGAYILNVSGTKNGVTVLRKNATFIKE